VANQSFDVTRTISATTLTIRGSLDINTASNLAEEIDKIVATKPTKVVVDLSSLDLIDSSGVAALVKLYKALRASNCKLEMKGTRDQPLAIFKLLRMDKVFDL
jgi:anti-sigma B factor antagonist